MKYLFYSTLWIALFLSACRSGKKTFQVEGTITSGEGKTMYLEQRALSGVVIIDSTKLKKSGHFRFSEHAPENPEFYQLRIDNQTTMFAIDSIEKITIIADAKNLSHSFPTKKSSVNQRIREIMKHREAISSEMKTLEKSHKNRTFTDMQYLSQVDSLLNGYKSYAIKLILGNPSSAAAYYAVFQKIDDYLIFDPYNREDYAMFAAVATSWQNYYPETPRTKHLHDFCLNALKTRKIQERNEKALHTLREKSTQTSLNNISLPDLNGRSTHLDSLKGSVVLLDFTAYKTKFSPQHNILIHEAYQHYKSQKFEVYQISFDSDEHFWKNAAANLPWIAVRDAQSVYSSLLKTYNIRELPTAFILNREGDIVTRIEDFSKLSGELSKIL